MFILTAEREACPPVQFAGEYNTLEEVAEAVWRLEEEDRWPEGHDAVARDPEARVAWFLADDWEPLEC